MRFVPFVIVSSLLVGFPALSRNLDEELSRHNKASDCWMKVEGKFYDLTAYLPEHEEYTSKLPEFCGKDATEAWNTKGVRGKPHSKKAALKLRKYLIRE